MKLTRCILMITMMLLLLTACGDKAEVEVSVAPVTPSESTFAITRLTANLLVHRPEHEMDKPDVLMMINQGDQIIPIQEVGDWTQVQHVLSGNVGWLHKSFVQVEEQSKWWSADTDRARQRAEKIYQDKIFIQKNWPIAHISIEERWNKMVLSIKEDRSFSKDNAVECARFCQEQLQKYFPDWKERLVFVNGKANGESYTLVLGDDGNPTFL